MTTRTGKLLRAEDITLNRRDLLKASGGLVVAFSLFSPVATVAAAPAGTAVKAGAATSFAPPPANELSSWLAIHPDNTVTLFTGKIDCGTGTLTALAQCAAEELDFPIDKVNVVMGTTSQTVDQGPTNDSQTVHRAGPQLQHAGAAGRQAMLNLAAKHYNVSPNQLTVKDGVISVVGANQSITFGELVAGQRLNIDIGATGKSENMTVAPKIKLKDPSTYTVIGTSVPRLDIPGKVTGEYTYVQDVKVPGMLHGRVIRPYGIMAHLESVDETGLKDIPGFVQVVRKKDFLGVVAETEWGAIQAAAKLGSVLDPTGPQEYGAKWSNWNGLVDQDKLWDVMRQQPGTKGSITTKGSVDVALKSAAKTLTATYETPYQTHGSIGPECAIADVRPDGATFWTGSQMPHQVRLDMATQLGMDPNKVEVRWFEASGAYGRNGLETVVSDAAVMSQAVGKPVRVQWMRWDTMGWDPKGTAITQDLTGALDKDGNVTAWRHEMWVPTWIDTTLTTQRLAGTPETGDVGQGIPAIFYAYTFPNADVFAHSLKRYGLLTCWLRSPAQSHLTFGMEAFVDELAAAAKQDPLAFRLKYLDDPRAVAVLQAAAKQYGWVNRPAHTQPQGTGNLVQGRGLAWVQRVGTYVATILDLTLDRSTGAFKVGRVVVAHDCGLVINPDGMKNQIEGNILQSMSRFIHEEVAFDNAHVTSRDWDAYPILKFEEIPDQIDIVFVNNTPEFPSTGGGEPSTNPTAAAISNAIFDATGVRLRRTPFRPNVVKAALSAAQ